MEVSPTSKKYRPRGSVVGSAVCAVSATGAAAKAVGGSLQAAARSGRKNALYDSSRPLFEVQLSGEQSADRTERVSGTATVELLTAGQHTLAWSAPICITIGADAIEIRPAKINLYSFPLLTFADLPGDLLSPPSQTEARVLRELLLALLAAGSGSHTFLRQQDSTGATPLLALLVANTEEALEICMSSFRRWPETMLQVHAAGPFLGEGVLHVLAVNQHEDKLIELTQLAVRDLDRTELEQLFWSQAEGDFFSTEPMLYYGGTPIGYAAAFSMTRLVALLLRLTITVEKVRGLFDLNDSRHACCYTGFLPVHVAVANGLTEFFDFLVAGPSGNAVDARQMLAMRASSDRTTALGCRRNLAMLTPLQLTVMLGDQRMFQHVLSKRAVIQWRWGPVTQLQLNLAGIDSCGVTGNDVMELICSLSATRGAQEMLLDAFMQGFLHKLFQEKWILYGRAFWLLSRVLEGVYLVLLLVLCYELKVSGSAGIGWPLPVCVLLSFLPILAEDARVTILWYQNYRRRPGNDEDNQRLSQWADVRTAAAWALSHRMHWKVHRGPLSPTTTILTTALPAHAIPSLLSTRKSPTPAPAAGRKYPVCTWPVHRAVLHRSYRRGRAVDASGGGDVPLPQHGAAVPLRPLSASRCALFDHAAGAHGHVL